MRPHNQVSRYKDMEHLILDPPMHNSHVTTNRRPQSIYLIVVRFHCYEGLDTCTYTQWPQGLHICCSPGHQRNINSHMHNQLLPPTPALHVPPPFHLCLTLNSFSLKTK